MAALHHAPILLSDPNTLDSATLAEIQRVLPLGQTVYLLGGTAALGPGVAQTLTGLGYEVVRYGGSNRYATAAAIASGLGNPRTILLADGSSFADALSAGTAAATAGGAVLLTDGTSVGAVTAAYLAVHPPSTLYALGGSAAAADPSAIKIAGADRYATAVLVAQTFFPKPTVVGLASGTNYPDALTGGANMAVRGGPMLLTDPDALSSETLAYLDSITSSAAVIDVFGGPAAISNAVVATVQQQG